MITMQRIACACALAATVTVAACGGGSSSSGGGGITGAVPQPTTAPTTAPLTPAGIYIADYAGNRVTVLSRPASGSFNPTVLGTIVGSNTGLSSPVAVAVDANGLIYVLSYIAQTVTVYPAIPRGTLNEAPIATISLAAENATTGCGAETALALDNAGKIYVAGPGCVQIYAANPRGAVTAAPLTVITQQALAPAKNSLGGAQTIVPQGRGVAVDATGRIYIADTFNDVLVLPANLTGTPQSITAVAVIAGSATMLNAPRGLALDSSGRIYVGSAGGITVYPANPSGTLNEAPIATISDPTLPLAYGLAVDSSGMVYAVTTGALFIYAPIGTGNNAAPPLLSITGDKFGMSAPTGVAVY